MCITSLHVRAYFLFCFTKTLKIVQIYWRRKETHSVGIPQKLGKHSLAADRGRFIDVPQHPDPQQGKEKLPASFFNFRIEMTPLKPNLRLKTGDKPRMSSTAQVDLHKYHLLHVLHCGMC